MFTIDLTKTTNKPSFTNDVTEILVCAVFNRQLKDTWEVVPMRGDGLKADEPIWCETRAEALRKARALFIETPTAQRVRAINKHDGCFQTVLTR